MTTASEFISEDMKDFLIISGVALYCYTKDIDIVITLQTLQAFCDCMVSDSQFSLHSDEC